MKRLSELLFVLVALLGLSVPAMAGPLFGQEPDPSVLVLRDNLQWIWAAPCSNGPGSCGDPTEQLGFRDPTGTEWTNSFADRNDLISQFVLPGDIALCGSNWMSSFHSHCDVGDLKNGHIWHAFGFCDPNYFNGCEAGTTETFLVREANEVPEPITLTVFGAGLVGAAMMRRRRVAKHIE